ncbi:M20/M25/M40 family metallo-hydrolase [Corynebacterium aquatimens]|uniref:Acetylornithine deacetylase/succinyl-diaminopimelate desuccinylase-like protein n=1 Tax=Corynebacterium aquatimens TaxID=1190508 RepID=A0A931GWI7_9CORY|nr:M20/M25/M40 family metallo-hydrolase [Corynebacterium aquatimens]MBG6122626.1 acetylornithine deacetylase/succinyl-diaminopimelate desuccinylase-like protein [Corynebacterium aquatimens]WJY64834.1 Succinyl-diaminopimelate desuccinylase [Corynebacterium aquatimens]
MSEAQLEDQAVDLLARMVRNGCVNDLTADSGEEVRNAETLEEFFAAEIADGTVTHQRFEPHPGRVTVAFTVKGSDDNAEPLTLLGHTDVVPVDEPKWTRDPFGAEIVDGKMYGRGTMDMLFITAAMAVVTRDVARSATPPRGTLTFVACADEEARGGLGAGWLARNHPEAISWKNCLSETGGSHLPVNDGSDAVIVVVGEKGAGQRRLSVHGDAGHGSAPYGRELTVGKIGEVARRVAAVEPDVVSDDIWEGYVKAFRFDPETEAQLLRGENYEALGGLARYSHAMSHLTIAPTVLQAGGAINVLPSVAKLELDVRPLPGQSQQLIDEGLRAALGDLDVEIEHLITEDATVSPTSGPLYDAMVETIHEFFPEATIVPTIAAGGSDLRFARNLGGVGYGFALHERERLFGDVLDQLHSHDEYVDVADVKLTTRAYRFLLKRFLGA